MIVVFLVSFWGSSHSHSIAYLENSDRLLVYQPQHCVLSCRMKKILKCINSLVHQQIGLAFKNSRLVVCLNRVVGDGIKYRPEFVSGNPWGRTLWELSKLSYLCWTKRRETTEPQDHRTTEASVVANLGITMVEAHRVEVGQWIERHAFKTAL